MATFNLPKIPDAPAAPLPGATTTTKDSAAGTMATAAAPINLATDAPPADPEQAMADAGSKVSDSGLPPQGMPNLPMPDTAIVPPAVPDGLALPATSLPEIHVERSKPKVATWQTRLAPSIIPPRTNFIYKRELLPTSIYATQYSRENSHLPVRVTREDYQAMLFNVVAKNDIDATRALLNAGTGLEVTNSFGETPLMVARRSGAQDVAALLTARGAHP